MGDFEWSHVKFICDGVVSNVRTSFFKEVLEGSKAPKDLRVGEHYKVFWSPNVQDTPQKLIEAGNDVLDMSDSANVRRSKKDGPLKGYFQAVLLDLENSEDSSDDVDKVTTKSKSRVRIPSNKQLNSQGSHRQKGEKSSSTNAETDNVKKSSNSKEILKQAAQQASKANILTLLEKCQVPASKSNMGVASRTSTPPSSEEDGDDDSHTSHAENDSGGADYWKKKFLELQSKSKKKSKKQKKYKSKGSPKEETAQASPKQQSFKDGSIKFKKVSKDDQHFTDSDNSSHSLKPGDEESEDQSSSDCEIDHKVNVHKTKIRAGSQGDSLLCFNKAAELWDPKVLAIRSVSGLASSRSPDTASRGYPKLTPKKVDKIKGALKKRINHDCVSKRESLQRMKNLNVHLAQKISTVRRSLRQKKINIPTAAAVWAVRDQNPEADGSSAYADSQADK